VISVQTADAVPRQAEMSIQTDEVVVDDEQQAAIKKLKLIRMKLRSKPSDDDVVEKNEYDELSSESETEELKEWRRKKREAEAEADQNSITSFVFDSVDQGVIPAEMSVPPDEVVLDDDQQAAIKKLKLTRMTLRGKPSEDVVKEDEYDESSSECDTEELKEW
jgi:ribosomal protein S14